MLEGEAAVTEGSASSGPVLLDAGQPGPLRDLDALALEPPLSFSFQLPLSDRLLSSRLGASLQQPSSSPLLPWLIFAFDHRRRFLFRTIDSKRF